MKFVLSWVFRQTEFGVLEGLGSGGGEMFRSYLDKQKAQDKGLIPIWELHTPGNADISKVSCSLLLLLLGTDCTLYLAPT